MPDPTNCNEAPSDKGAAGRVNRDAVPDYADRVRRLGDLIAAPALPIADVAIYLDVPLSTLDKLRMQGDGPRCFKIGRRLYVRQADLHAWFDRLAEQERAA